MTKVLVLLENKRNFGVRKEYTDLKANFREGLGSDIFAKHPLEAKQTSSAAPCRADKRTCCLMPKKGKLVITTRYTLQVEKNHLTHRYILRFQEDRFLEKREGFLKIILSY